MSATIEILGEQYTVNAGHWSGADVDVIGYLRALTAELGDSPSIPDLDEALIIRAANEIGATIVSHSDSASTFAKGVIY